MQRKFTTLQKLSLSAALLISLLALSACKTPVPDSEVKAKVVTYEDFGAVGDGVTDDLPAIVAAHAYANEHGLPVHSKPDAVYHLGRRALTAIIETNTDWSTSRFIIDDSRGVEDFRKPVFHVRSTLQPISIEIDHLSKGQEKLNQRPATTSLVQVENANRKLFIRRGLNPSSGDSQKEAFILHEDGTIEGAIEWEYETVTEVTAMPIDPEPLVLRGGVFTTIGNAMKQEEGSQGSKYSSRLILFRRDYGSTWEGNIVVRNSRWIVQDGGRNFPVMFRFDNDGTHDFGYPCFMPETILIDGLFVDDAKYSNAPEGIPFFSDVLGPSPSLVRNKSAAI